MYIESVRERYFQRNIYFCFVKYKKTLNNLTYRVNNMKIP